MPLIKDHSGVFKAIKLVKIIRPLNASSPTPHQFSLHGLNYADANSGNFFAIDLEIAEGFSDFILGIVALKQPQPGLKVELRPKGGLAAEHVHGNRYVHQWSRDPKNLITEDGDYLIEIDVEAKNNFTHESLNYKTGFMVHFNDSFLEIRILQPENDISCEYGSLQNELKELIGEVIEGAPPFEFSWEVEDNTGHRTQLMAAHTANDKTNRSGIPDYNVFKLGEN
jgi:hypothetical protein